MSQIGALFGGLFGDAGQNFVNEQGGADRVFGTKPDVAAYTPIDLQAETAKATAGNLANYDSITALLDKIIPGFSGMLAQGTANTTAELQGQLPPDVAAQVQRSAAYKSLQGGYGGTGMAGALSARDLGLTSLNLTQMGNNSAQLWSNIAESAYSPFTVSTGQQAATTAANNAGLQAQQQYQFNVDAAPDPGAAGVFGLDKELGMQMLSFGMGAAGGAIAGGGAGAAYNYIPSTGQYGAVPGYSYGAQGYTSNGAVNGGDWRTNATWGTSDRRLKKDIVLMGATSGGLNLYEFSYIWEEGPAAIRHIGVMADEVEIVMPEAVRTVNGYKQVDYSKVPL